MGVITKTSKVAPQEFSGEFLGKEIPETTTPVPINFASKKNP
jgi:hypothetical protein